VAGAILAFLRGRPLQIGWFDNARQRAHVRRRIAAGEYDVAYTYYVRSAEVARGIAPAHDSSARPATYLAMQLAQSLNTKRIFERTTKLRDKIIYGFEHRAIRRYEAHVWRDFTRTVLIGKNDVNEIRDACREYHQPELDNYLLCAHGVDVDRFRPRPEEMEERTLVFSGVLATNTNVEAITWFVRHCWGRVKAAAPGAKLYVVGRNPQPGVVALGRDDPSITVTGEVPDPADYIARATVCINPMQAGAGMQNKLIEYLASAKAVVATTVANEGIMATPGEHFVAADTPEAFADATIALLNDPERRATLGASARAYIERDWTWARFFAELEEDMLAGAAPGAPADG
jgi:glycosyltransferase involved in cell wall biosynthesis